MAQEKQFQTFKYFLINSRHDGQMRVFIFLSVFYALMIAFGFTQSYADNGKKDETINSELSALAANEGMIQKIEELIAQIETKISPEKMQSLIQAAAKDNPQVAELLKIVQQYGVLTEITLDDAGTTNTLPE